MPWRSYHEQSQREIQPSWQNLHLNEWDWYHDMLGSTYKGDAWQNDLPLIILDETNPSTKDLPNPWKVNQQYRKNNWAFDENTPDFHVLVKVDPSHYEGHIGDWSNQLFVPFIYTHEFEGGRAWYGGMGHNRDSFKTDSEWYTLMSWGVDYAFGKFEDTGTVTINIPEHTPVEINGGKEVYSINGSRKVFQETHSGDFFSLSCS